MGKLKKIFTNWRVLFLIIFVIGMIVAIRPSPGADGVTILNIAKNSSAALGGFESPKPAAAPMTKERITHMNNIPIKSLSDYYDFTNGLDVNQTVSVRTTRGIRTLITKENLEIITLNETELVNITETIEVNETVDNETVLVNQTINKTVERNKTTYNSLGLEDIGFTVSEAPTSNIRKGLDLQGGTRVLLKPAEEVNEESFLTIIDSMKERLNIYGLGDIVVTDVREPALFGGEEQKFILVEIAGASQAEVKDLISRQGKFEATIANDTVFKGGDDIPYVCRTAQCSGLDPQRGCNPTPEGGWACAFQFAITLTPEAAKRQADATSLLGVEGTGVNARLTEDIVLYLDDQEVDRLSISPDLKGRPVTDISISGSGEGVTQADAQQDALNNMKKLQTVLITGSLPVKLDIVKADEISPVLGEQFLKNAWFIGLLAMLSVAVVIVIAYRKIVLAIPIIATMLSEVVSILGMAALIGWNLDLAAIAGIIVAVGTGVDDQIVILSETLKGGQTYMNWKDMLKKAFFIIFSAYATTVVAMIPLLFAGAGLLKGFAITTILGVSIGVFVARPAYAAVVKILFEE